YIYRELQLSDPSNKYLRDTLVGHTPYCISLIQTIYFVDTHSKIISTKKNT
ncbi:unnamed protein product, partial [Prunus brigantina]